MSTLTIVGIDVILLVALLMLSVPLPYCFGGALLFMSLLGGVSMKSMMLWAYSQSIGTVLLASPLFILAGTYMGGSGVAKKLLDLCHMPQSIREIKGRKENLDAVARDAMLSIQLRHNPRTAKQEDVRNLLEAAY